MIYLVLIKLKIQFSRYYIHYKKGFDGLFLWKHGMSRASTKGGWKKFFAKTLRKRIISWNQCGINDLSIGISHWPSTSHRWDWKFSSAWVPSVYVWFLIYIINPKILLHSFRCLFFIAGRLKKDTGNCAPGKIFGPSYFEMALVFFLILLE